MIRLVRLYTWAGVLELLRYPSYSVPTLLFPTVIFAVFGSRQKAAPPEALLASYAGLALLGIAFFQFGVGIAAERATPWQRFVRVLPAPPSARIAARFLSALVFGAGACVPLFVLAFATTGVRLAAREWVALPAVLLLGAAPFALFGVAIGYWSSPKGALPVANVVYLSLSYLGGLWTASQHLPGALSGTSAWLPTRLWGGLLTASVGDGAWSWRAAALIGYAALFGWLAVWGFRRDEGARFG
ncbi:MAG: ABC transporter permease [Gaiellaceae bacterium]